MCCPKKKPLTAHAKEVRKTFAEQPAEGTAEAEAAANAAAVREKTAEVAAPRSSMAKGFLNRTWLVSGKLALESQGPFEL